MVMMRGVIRSARAEALWRRSVRKTHLDIENMFTDEETKLYYNKECGIDGGKSLNEVKGELK